MRKNKKNYVRAALALSIIAATQSLVGCGAATKPAAIETSKVETSKVETSMEVKGEKEAETVHAETNEESFEAETETEYETVEAVDDEIYFTDVEEGEETEEFIGDYGEVDTSMFNRDYEMEYFLLESGKNEDYGFNYYWVLVDFGSCGEDDYLASTMSSNAHFRGEGISDEYPQRFMYEYDLGNHRELYYITGSLCDSDGSDIQLKRFNTNDEYNTNISLDVPFDRIGNLIKYEDTWMLIHGDLVDWNQSDYFESHYVKMNLSAEMLDGSDLPDDTHWSVVTDKGTVAKTLGKYEDYKHVSGNTVTFGIKYTDDDNIEPYLVDKQNKASYIESFAEDENGNYILDKDGNKIHKLNMKNIAIDYGMHVTFINDKGKRFYINELDYDL